MNMLTLNGTSVDVRYLTLYNIKPNPANNTNIQVTDCEVFLYLQNLQAYHVASTGIISATGSKVVINGLPKVDEAKIIVKSFTGTITGQTVAGLAEVVTNARISYYDVFGIKPISSFAEKFKLEQNYPNPFNPSTKIKYSIPFSNNSINNVKLVVYDILGREIKTLVNQVQNSGTYEVQFDSQNLASCVYFYRLLVLNHNKVVFSDVKKMVVLK